MTLHIGRGITTDPIRLRIQTKPVKFLLYGGVQVPVAKSPKPLDFHFGLALQDLNVGFEGDMNGYWVDPFGLGEGVRIGPHVGLSLEIDLPIFFETGTPTTLKFDAEMKIGEATAAVGVVISEVPTRKFELFTSCSGR